MTTIAYRDGVLAADSLVTGGGIRFGKATKAWKSADGSLFAVAGSMFHLNAARAWADGDRCGSPPPIKENHTFIHVTPGGTVREWQGDGWLEIHMPFVAWGSGEAFALGAMAMGAAAGQAVEVAAQFNIYTGGDITVLKLEA